MNPPLLLTNFRIGHDPGASCCISDFTVISLVVVVLDFVKKARAGVARHRRRGVRVAVAHARRPCWACARTFPLVEQRAAAPIAVSAMSTGAASVPPSASSGMPGGIPAA